MRSIIPVLKDIFGEYYGLVRQIIQSTLMFIVLLLAIFVVRTLLALLFPSDDFISRLLRIIDGYATLLGIVGFVVWITLDLYFLLQQARKKVQDEN